jgi:hypothetical protein
MKNVAVIHLNGQDHEETVTFLGQPLQLHYRGCHGNAGTAVTLIQSFDGNVDAIVLDGLPATLQLGSESRKHEVGATLASYAKTTPVIDGGGIRAGLERWAVILADRAQPGIFSSKRVLMTPALNHNGLAQSLGRMAGEIRYADPIIFFGLPDFPGVATKSALDQAAPFTLDELKLAPFRRLLPQAGDAHKQRAEEATSAPFAAMRRTSSRARSLSSNMPTRPIWKI